MPYNKHDNASLSHFDIDELMIQNQAISVTCNVLKALALLLQVVIFSVFDHKND